jgi:hypothetical protein
MKPLRSALLATLITLGMDAPAGATVSAGDPAPNFTKNELDSPSPGLTTPRTLADYSGKVIVFFLFGCT